MNDKNNNEGNQNPGTSNSLLDLQEIVPRDKLEKAVHTFLEVIGLPEVSLRPESLPFPCHRYNHPDGTLHLESLDDQFAGNHFPAIQLIEVVRQYNRTEDDEEDLTDDEEESLAGDAELDLGAKRPVLLLIDVEEIHPTKNATFKDFTSFLVNGLGATRRRTSERHFIAYPTEKAIKKFLDQFDQADQPKKEAIARVGKKVLEIETEEKMPGSPVPSDGGVGLAEPAGEPSIQRKEGPDQAIYTSIQPITPKREEKEMDFKDVMALGVFPPYILRGEDAPEYFKLSDETVDTSRVTLEKVQEIFDYCHEICEGRTFYKIGGKTFDTTLLRWYTNRSYFAGMK
mgnify:CR=1 FL=1